MEIWYFIYVVRTSDFLVCKQRIRWRLCVFIGKPQVSLFHASTHSVEKWEVKLDNGINFLVKFLETEVTFSCWFWKSESSTWRNLRGQLLFWFSIPKVEKWHFFRFRCVYSLIYLFIWVGGSWKPLRKPPVDAHGVPYVCPVVIVFLFYLFFRDAIYMWLECWISYGSIQVQYRTIFTHLIGFYSVPNAIGIILAAGNVGTSLTKNISEINTYVSRVCLILLLFIYSFRMQESLGLK